MFTTQPPNSFFRTFAVFPSVGSVVTGFFRSLECCREET
ncbi:hypothetical protein NJ7G_2819 [Natrinema sp. J7-2]|nr:hypothetical protein NJ7G_2819 [Natrinema sp. J7-2]